MICFFGAPKVAIFVVETQQPIDPETSAKLQWLFGDQPQLDTQEIEGGFVGPRSSMITPWSTNAVEITQNMGVEGISRIETFLPHTSETNIDPMLFDKYQRLDQDIFTINTPVAPIEDVQDIAAYNQTEGLALTQEEVAYLENLSQRIGRPLTDSEVFGFSQVNSEHCRHKIFNGTFVIDGETKESSLFGLIKKTSKVNPNTIVSAYSDNVAFVEGPDLTQFAPQRGDTPTPFEKKKIPSVLSLKAETHNFPTTVEPFNGAATGSGGEIRDRLAGGQGSLPLAGTAVYMTPYSRVTEDRPWETAFAARPWRYQTPLEILIKASNGASDFGNKFGQPLIAGSLFTFEYQDQSQRLGYDKVIMLAGGVGYGHRAQAQKKKPQKGDKIIILGGDNYRIGMGGAAVSSTDTGNFGNTIELNAVQRSNPEMQKRVANAIRALVESAENPIISIHDHGAGGHLNCLSELVESTGGLIALNKLPVGDPTLSAKELIGNESQERMGLILAEKDVETLQKIAARERAPMYVVGTVTDDHRFVFAHEKKDEKPIDLNLSDFFGNPPKTIMEDQTQARTFAPLNYQTEGLEEYLTAVLQLEAVACKDWLTNKVDRCVTGRVAQQQTVGPLQLPLSNCGVVSLDYEGKSGIATSIGHAPLSSLIDPKAGSINAIAEALTNIVWAPLEKGIDAVTLSANWMWPCNNPGEDRNLYEAVQACSDYAIALGINIPTGKDSLSMKQKYPEGDVVAPGTVIISAAGHCDAIQKTITPVITQEGGDLYYINLSKDQYFLGGSSFAQICKTVGNQTPQVQDAAYFRKAFNHIQALIRSGIITAGHDVSSGGLITALLEGCFPSVDVGITVNLNAFENQDSIALLFAENSAVWLQSKEDLATLFRAEGIECIKIGTPNSSKTLTLSHQNVQHALEVEKYRDLWFQTSEALDAHQTKRGLAQTRFENYKKQPLAFQFPSQFDGKLPELTQRPKIKAAVLREKGSNSEREMAYAMSLAGFEVTDIHMTDLIEGRTTLEPFQFIVAVGGFSNSDVLGSAKGWAGAFMYNEKAKKSLDDFFQRKDTLSLGVCNGCQLFVELGLLTPELKEKPKMLHNDSGKFECQFTAVHIEPSPAVMLQGMEGSTLGIWAAHGEGKFYLPGPKAQYHIPATYHYADYPANPNGSDHNAAMLTSDDGRHLVMMPHLERATFPWNWAHYPGNRQDEVSPWILAFSNAYKWLQNHV